MNHWNNSRNPELWEIESLVDKSMRGFQTAMELSQRVCRRSDALGAGAGRSEKATSLRGCDVG